MQGRQSPLKINFIMDMPQLRSESPGDTATWFDTKECVVLEEYMGSDMTVVNAARVSYAKQRPPSDPISEGDAGLIKYLAREKHESPFFHPQIRFRIKMPLYVAREWFRSTVGFARNEVSRRYVQDTVQCFVPTELRKSDPSKKQGSMDESIDNNEQFRKLMIESSIQSIMTYRRLLEAGVAREQARTVLPQSMMTEFVETGSLFAYARIVCLRISPRAQYEIQCYAREIDLKMRELFPVSWAALMASSDAIDTDDVSPTYNPNVTPCSDPVATGSPRLDTNNTDTHPNEQQEG